ncbi:MAG: class I SAM-dependent methyltransferase [Bacteroidota bacterium]
MNFGDKESRRSHWEDFWQEKQEIEEVYSNEDRIIRNLQRVIGLQGKRILEIGAGTGRDSFPLAEAGADVIQLDYAENSLLILKNLARQRGLQTSIVAGDTFQLPFRDNTFDVVFHQGLLEHFRKPQAEKLLRENIRVLKPGGHLLVDVPQRYHVYTLAKHMLMAMNQWFAGWERSFSIRELAGELRGLGLTPVLSYGEWMYPSFFYRAMREAAKKAGLRLPLSPTVLPFLTRLRAQLRSGLRKTPVSLYTGISIGVISRK